MKTLGANRVYNRGFEKGEWENKTCKLIGQETINSSEQLPYQAYMHVHVCHCASALFPLKYRSSTPYISVLEVLD